MPKALTRHGNLCMANVALRVSHVRTHSDKLALGKACFWGDHMKHLLIGICAFFTLFYLGCEPVDEYSGTLAKNDSVAGQCPEVEAMLVKKNSDLFTQKLYETLDAVSMNEDVLPVGSYSYVSHPYPGDIDVHESVIVNKSKEEAKHYFSQRLTNIAQRIASDPEIFFSDAKAGEDKSVVLDIGKSDAPGSFSGYNYASLTEHVKRFFDNGLITAEERDELLALIKPDLTYLDWTKLKEAAHNLATLRWSLQELLAQKKLLRDKNEISLANAIEGAMVKIDVLSPVTKHGYYTELSNFIELFYIDEGKQKYVSVKSADYIESISKDVLEFYNPAKKKALKASKRLWILAVAKKDYQLIAKLMPLLQSDAAGLNQIIAESEVIRSILKPERKIVCSPVGLKLIQQIASFEKRTLNHTNAISTNDFSNPQDGLTRTSFDALTTNCPEDAPGLDNIVISDRVKEIATNNLLKLEEKLKPIIEKMTLEYLQKVNINPMDPFASLSGTVAICPVVND